MYGTHFHSERRYNDEIFTGANEVMMRIDMETLAQLPRQGEAIASFQGCYNLDPIGCADCVPGLYGPLIGTLLGAWEASPGLRVHHNFLGWELPFKPEWFRWPGQWNSEPHLDYGNLVKTDKYYTDQYGKTPLTDGGLPALNSALHAGSALHGTRISQLMCSGARRILSGDKSMRSRTWPHPYIAESLRKCASVADVCMH